MREDPTESSAKCQQKWERDVCVEHSLSLSVKHLFLHLALSFLPPPSSVYHFSQPLSSSLRLAANNAGVVRYHRLLQGVEAAERLSSKTKHLYSVIHLIVIPHSSIPLPSASLSIIHLTLIYSACLSVRGHLPAFQQPGETRVCCVALLLQHICVSVCGLFDGVNRQAIFKQRKKKAAFSKVWQGLKEEPPSWRECFTVESLAFSLLICWSCLFSPSLVLPSSTIKKGGISCSFMWQQEKQQLLFCLFLNLE